MRRGWSVGVVIPARNEEDSIAGCLEAVHASIDACAGVDELRIAVVADACTDGTVERARAAIRGRGEVIECSARSAGAARRTGVSRVLQLLAAATPTSRIWLANTDADSAPAVDWLLQQRVLADRGYCGVAGIVRLEDSERPDVVRSHITDYVVHPDGSHPHVHGANLGIRADAYLDAGGWSNAPLAEDHCLWQRLQARRWRTVSSIASVVTTSGRLQGRASGGFADALRAKVESIWDGKLESICA